MKQPAKNAKPEKSLQPQNTAALKTNTADKTHHATTKTNQQPISRFLEAACDCV